MCFIQEGKSTLKEVLERLKERKQVVVGEEDGRDRCLISLSMNDK